MTRARDEDGVQIILLDETVLRKSLALSFTRAAYGHPYHVDVCEALPSIRAPMSQQASLEVIQSKRIAEQRISPQVYHAEAHV